MSLSRIFAASPPFWRRAAFWILGMALAGATTEVATAAPQPPPKPLFELVHGDRVVFLGGTLIEREQRYGRWEAALTARFRDRIFTVRNLGWSGDTVWADSRGIFDPPAEGYRRMLDQIRELKPTVIFVNYGANEAFAGADGLPAFREQFGKLLDDVGAGGAKIIILSPTRQIPMPPPLPDPATHNADLAVYTDALRDVAKQRELLFVDLFSPLPGTETTAATGDAAEPSPLTDNGIHFTDQGYTVTAQRLLEQLECNRRPTRVRLNAEGIFDDVMSAGVQTISMSRKGIKFKVEPDQVLEVPMHMSFAGLAPGQYTLKVEGETVATASESEWDQGIALAKHPDVAQARALREAIVAKNLLYFHRWRPQNVTYLFGFRKHEQGQNAKEIAEFDALVAEQEERIVKLRSTKRRNFELSLDAEGSK